MNTVPSVAIVSGISPEQAEHEARERSSGQREPRVHVEELHERQREQTADDRELALGEIDDPGGPQDDVYPQGHERVTAADGQSRDKELEHSWPRIRMEETFSCVLRGLL
jgi:hypothetical protein